MKKKSLRKDILREIIKSKERFLSIIVLIALGVFALVGLKATGPNMRNTANDYYKAHNLADISIMSTHGLDSKDEKTIASIDNIKDIEFDHHLDTTIKNTNSVIRILSNSSKVSKYDIVKGRLPKKDGEIAIDSNLESSDYAIGKSISFIDDENTKYNLKNTSYRIVGLVNSSEYIQKNNLGSSQIGTGSLNGFAVVSDNEFSSPIYTIARISFYDTNNLKFYKNNYEKTVNKHKLDLEEALKNRPKEKLENLKQKIYLDSQINSFDSSDNIATEQFSDNLDLPIYFIRDRIDNPGYLQYLENSKRIDTLSTVFPAFFFLIAILICFTTMTRMANEQRIQVGTLKALGYSNFDIIKKFLLYSIFSSLFGTCIGLILGHYTLPKIIFNAYAANFIFKTLKSAFFLNYSIIATSVAIFCTTASSVVSIISLLKENSARLMRPKPPSSGSRSLLEKIPVIWRFLSFNQKITIRNLFRYKKRMFMTILGITGCSALLVTGFGIRDSLSGIIDTQFSEILRYDIFSTYDDKSSLEEIENYKNNLKNNNYISKSATLFSKKIKAKPDGISSQNVSMISFESESDFKIFYYLRNSKTHKSLKVSDEGVIISEKLANLFSVKVGENIKFSDENNKTYLLKVGGVAEMYAEHYMFISPEYYKEVFNKDMLFNSSAIILKNSSKSYADSVSKSLTKEPIVNSVIQMSKANEIVDTVLKSLNYVVIVLILCASLLAITVLYNLTNINISERIGELSTIKVLGFFPKEVTVYVYRENIILTFFGITGGYILGFYLHKFIIEALPPYDVMFKPGILLSNYILSGVIVIILSLLVMFFMHFRLKSIDMVESLKSVD